MLFHVVWDFTDQSEEGARRTIDLFTNWSPPAGANVQGFYGFADGSGGMMIVDIEGVADLARMTAPWTPYLSFTATPILPVEESAGISAEGIAFRDSVD
jgi:hypothetical protein